MPQFLSRTAARASASADTIIVERRARRYLDCGALIQTVAVAAGAPANPNSAFKLRKKRGQPAEKEILARIFGAYFEQFLLLG